MPRRKTMHRKPPAASSKSSNKSTTFLDLPAEIRNVIYELALDGALNVCFPKASDRNKKGRAKCPGLLLASKQIHHEALIMFYSKATFSFTVIDKRGSWLRKIGAKKRALLNRIVFHADLNMVVISSVGPFESQEYQDLVKRRVFNHAGAVVRRLHDCGLILSPGLVSTWVSTWTVDFTGWRDGSYYELLCRQNVDEDTEEYGEFNAETMRHHPVEQD